MFWLGPLGPGTKGWDLIAIHISNPDVATSYLESQGVLGFCHTGANISVPDASGRETKLTLWWNFGQDSYGQMGSVNPALSHRTPFVFSKRLVKHTLA